MTTIRRAPGRASRLGLGAILLFTVAACGAAAPSPSPTPAAPTPTPVPVASGTTGGGPGGGNVGSGIFPPPANGGPAGDPNLGQAAVVVPVPGQLDVHAVGVVLIRSAVVGRHVTIELRWWSGVAPCTVLDSVQVQRDGMTFTMTPMEGTSGRDVMCDMLAQLKATVVDLGDLEPGTYTIKAFGDPPAIEVMVS